MKFPRLTVGVIVALAFGGFIALGFLLSYLLRDVPTPDETCQRRCTSINRSARLVPIYPPAQTSGMRSRGPMRCECY
jgi:hypothetical protein